MRKFLQLAYNSIGRKKREFYCDFSSPIAALESGANMDDFSKIRVMVHYFYNIRFIVSFYA